MLSYDKQLKALSQHLRKNMTDAENMLRLKLRRKQLKGHQFYRQKIIGKYIVDFYPPSQNAPSGRTGMNAKRVSAEALVCQKTCLRVRSVSVKAGLASRSAKEDMLRRVSPKL